jgi:diguanylate cyclase (GGDEF)-like protein
MDIYRGDGYYGLKTTLANTPYGSIQAEIKLSNKEKIAIENKMRSLLLFLSAISLVISYIGVRFIADKITTPLRTLANVAEKIKAGDYSKAAGSAEEGEFGLLAESFNIMRDSITTLLRLAYRDALTNLPNRAMFTDRLNQAIEHAVANRAKFTLFFLDLNRFKEVNDTYGHDAGDLVLISVSQRLVDTMRPTDLAARLGGDEFAIILDSADTAIINTIKEKISRAIESDPINLGSNSVYVGTSIGAAIYPDDAVNAKDLMHHADLAMYATKNKAREIPKALP